MTRTVATIVCFDISVYAYTLSISEDGEVYYFGTSRAFGSRSLPKILPQYKNINSIACGDKHTLFLDIEGNIFSIGENYCGKLGLNRTQKKLFYLKEPQKVNLPPCKQVNCGKDFTMCVSQNGDVYSFGVSKSGELGHGNYDNLNSPKKIESLENVDFVECGEAHTICKTFDNTYFVWGDNYYGQLGVGNDTSQNKPFNCENWPEIVDIKCGDLFTAVLSTSGEVYTCGYNFDFQLGRKTKEESHSVFLERVNCLPEIVRIECGKGHTMCIDIHKNLFVFGFNHYGQLGLGNSSSTEAIKHPSLTDVIDISSGGWHSFVKTSTNEIYAFGNSRAYQLGVQAEGKTYSPIQVLKGQEDIWCAANSIKSKAKSARF